MKWTDREILLSEEALLTENVLYEERTFLYIYKKCLDYCFNPWVNSPQCMAGNDSCFNAPLRHYTHDDMDWRGITMSRRYLLITMVLAAVAFISAQGRSEYLFKKDGSIIHGKITRENAKSVTIKAASGPAAAGRAKRHHAHPVH
jgi:hypothetical protein